MPASPATLDRFTAALAGNGGGAVVRVAALTPSRPAGATLAAEVRFVAAGAAGAAGSSHGGVRTAMARAGAILLQSGLESPDAAKVDISVDTRQRARRRRTRRYAERRAVAVR